MLKSRRNEILVALVLVAPFVAIYGWLFIYPTIQMVQLSFTNAPLIGAGDWVGFDNYMKLFADRVFRTAVWNTSYFVLLTVIPGTMVGARHRADGEPPEGLAAEPDAGGLLPALHPAGDGRLPDLAVDDSTSSSASCSTSSSRSSAQPVNVFRRSGLVHADGGAGHDLVDQRLQHPPLPRRPAEHLRPRSTRRPSSTAPAAGSSSARSPGR